MKILSFCLVKAGSFCVWLREVLSSWVQLKDIVRLQENCNEKLQKKLPEVSLAIEDDYDIGKKGDGVEITRFYSFMDKN